MGNLWDIHKLRYYSATHTHTHKTQINWYKNTMHETGKLYLVQKAQGTEEYTVRFYLQHI